MKPKTDIYNHDRQLRRFWITLESAAISSRNKELIRSFDRTCFLEALSKSRRLKIARSLLKIATEYMMTDFDQATKEDIQTVVMSLDGRDDYSPWTKHGYKAILKKFYKWLRFGDEYQSHPGYPSEVGWLRCTLKAKRVFEKG